MHFVYPVILFLGAVLLGLILLYKQFLQKIPVYRYSLTHKLKEQVRKRIFISRSLFTILRCCFFISLLVALARPRRYDTRTEITVQGIDIMLALDVSGSMMLFDDMNDRRSRIDIAREEASSFIKKRPYDPIGLVLFGREVLTRAPLTLDKNMLTSILATTQVGTINSEGTLLFRGLAAAVHRLRDSVAKSKIIILLTDGTSTEGDVNPQIVVDLAQKLGIKIYTIAIGSDEGGMFDHPFYGTIPAPASEINKPLLKFIADSTGGRFFQSQKPEDLAAIYDTIDALEKTELTSPLFENYFEYFYYFLLLSLVLLCIEYVLRFYRLVLT